MYLPWFQNLERGSRESGAGGGRQGDYVTCRRRAEARSIAAERCGAAAPRRCQAGKTPVAAFHLRYRRYILRTVLL
jgi:hypothetical protein